MAKGYLIARVDVTNPAAWAEYAKGSSEAVRLHGGRFLARGGRHEALEGEARGRNIVLEFDSFEAAHAFYVSPEYQAAKMKRAGAGVGEFMLLEGV